MPIDSLVKKPLLLSAMLLAGVALAGCAADGPVKGTAEAVGMATTPQESKAFVRATRPSEMEYIPVGTTIPVAQLCPGPNPPPAYTPSGQSAHFAAPKPLVDPSRLQGHRDAPRIPAEDQRGGRRDGQGARCRDHPAEASADSAGELSRGPRLRR